MEEEKGIGLAINSSISPVFFNPFSKTFFGEAIQATLCKPANFNTWSRRFFFNFFLIVFNPTLARRISHTGGLALVRLSIIFILAPNPLAAAKSQVEPSEKLEKVAVGWAIDYLYTSLFLQSFLFFSEIESANSNFTKQASNANKVKQPVNSKDFSKLLSMELSDFAAYAIQNALRKGFSVTSKERIEKLLNEAELQLPSAKVNTTATSATTSQQEQIIPVFSNAIQQKMWEGVQNYLGLYKEKTGCNTPFLTIAKFADNQKKLLRNHQEIKGNLLTGLEDASLAGLTCIAIALMGASENAKKSGGFEPIYLLRLLDSRQQKTGSLPSLQIMLATRLLQLKSYSAALKTIAKILPDRPELRLAYDQIQRIYSYAQKGSGQVAIQSL